MKAVFATQMTRALPGLSLPAQSTWLSRRLVSLITPYYHNSYSASLPALLYKVRLAMSGSTPELVAFLLAPES